VCHTLSTDISIHAHTHTHTYNEVFLRYFSFYLLNHTFYKLDCFIVIHYFFHCIIMADLQKIVSKFAVLDRLHGWEPGFNPNQTGDHLV
jgi:hypothetical protein